MTNRAQRRARVRRGVAAGAAALFVASFGAVATWGRQPAAKVAAAPAPAASDTQQQQQQQQPPQQSDPYDPYGYDQYGQDPGYGGDPGAPPSDDQGQSQPSDPSAGQDSSPAPMTTRQS
jgi:hypothetical protein